MKYNPKVVLAFFAEHDLPEPQLEYVFNKPDTKHRFDFAWPFHDGFVAGGLALEVQGAIWIGKGHGRGSGIRRDMTKANLAAAKNWRVIYCEPSELCTLNTVNLIKRCLHHSGCTA